MGNDYDYVPVGRPSAGILAQAINITTVGTAISTPGGAGAAVVVLSTTVDVFDSDGMEVSLEFEGSFNQSVVGSGTFWLLLFEGATFITAAQILLGNSIDPALAAITTGLHVFPIGEVVATRTFHLRALLFSPVGQTPAGTVVNAPNSPTLLRAVAFA